MTETHRSSRHCGVLPGELSQLGSGIPGNGGECLYVSESGSEFMYLLKDDDFKTPVGLGGMRGAMGEGWRRGGMRGAMGEGSNG